MDQLRDNVFCTHSSNPVTSCVRNNDCATQTISGSFDVACLSVTSLLRVSELALVPSCWLFVCVHQDRGDADVSMQCHAII